MIGVLEFGEGRERYILTAALLKLVGMVEVPSWFGWSNRPVCVRQRWYNSCKIPQWNPGGYCQTSYRCCWWWPHLNARWCPSQHSSGPHDLPWEWRLFPVMDWPARSPDWNPVEHVIIIKTNAFVEEWQDITQNDIVCVAGIVWTLEGFLYFLVDKNNFAYK